MMPELAARVKMVARTYSTACLSRQHARQHGRREGEQEGMQAAMWAQALVVQQPLLVRWQRLSAHQV
jgi:hypothetical protein